MSCALHEGLLPKGKGVQVNGIAITRDVIAREVQQHPSRTPIEAWKAAAQALVVRELLLQEARKLGIAAEPLEDSEGRRETGEEAAVRALIAREVHTPKPDEESCRRYYEQNRRRFRSPDLYEAAHILFAAAKGDAEGYAKACAEAAAVLAILREQPERFGELARVHSACSSAAQDGNLGQISSGQTTPEFEAALVLLAPGSISIEPVATRYGLHIIRYERKIEGRELPFEWVADRIADYLSESVHRRATAQYIARLASTAEIAGVDLPNPETLRVN
jgi:peptidyl-prolyl cis-trans isomerase C